jgi:hypothetical protein
MALQQAQAAQAKDGSPDVPLSDSPSDLAPNATDPDAADEYVGDAVRSASKRDVVRSVDLVPTADGDGRTLEGYAAVFESPCEIDSWEGHFRESIQRGAFAKTISERKPALMFDHGRHPYIGNMPIGKITDIREDSRGLFVQARLTESPMTEPVRAAIAAGAISGMSVRMNVVKDSWSAGAGNIAERSIKEVGLIELGPVPFPAYEATSVSTRSSADNAAAGTDGSAADTAEEPTVDDGHSLEVLRGRAKALIELSR